MISHHRFAKRKSSVIVRKISRFVQYTQVRSIIYDRDTSITRFFAKFIVHLLFI